MSHSEILTWRLKPKKTGTFDITVKVFGKYIGKELKPLGLIQRKLTVK